MSDGRTARFPAGFLWGASTSSHQVEGDNRLSDWWQWEREFPSRIRDRLPSGDAAGWWHGMAEADLALAARLGHNAHRLSLEWSRLEPSPDRFDARAFKRYGDILQAARSSGLSLFVNFNHFTLPRWVGRRGWLEPKLPAMFARYAARCVEVFGDLVTLWATINEPIVLTWKAYATRQWPPGIGDPSAAPIALRQQLRGHAEAYHAAKRARRDAQVGIVLNLPTFTPARPEQITDRYAASTQRWFASGAILRALATGWVAPPVGLQPQVEPILARSLDFLGVNYYGRYVVEFDPALGVRGFGRHVQNPTIRTETSDWGQPHPHSLVAELEAASTLGVPLYVAENGIYDPDDSLRPGFIESHIEALSGAVARGLDLRGYFHWSLIDNYEWAQGWSTPFGLIELDRRAQTRKVRPSAYVLEALARNGV